MGERGGIPITALIQAEGSPVVQRLEKRVYKMTDANGQLVAAKVYKYYDSSENPFSHSRHPIRDEFHAYKVFLRSPLKSYIPNPLSYLSDAEGRRMGFTVEWKDGVSLEEALPEDRLTEQEFQEFKQVLLSFAGKRKIPQSDMISPANIMVTPGKLHTGNGSRIWFSECKFENRGNDRSQYLETVEALESTPRLLV